LLIPDVFTLFLNKDDDDDDDDDDVWGGGWGGQALRSITTQCFYFSSPISGGFS